MSGPRHILRQPLAALRAFRREEDGGMIIFSLFLLVIMLVIGGMAVDLMRFESTRARLQSTLDRCILMAADLDQLQDAESVVEDCFDKADLLHELTYIDVVESINSRQVTASAAMDVNTFFMDMIGFPMLTAPAGGSAIEAVADIEIILVLDVSGSMASNNRLPDLKEAATEFVESMFEGDADNRISIGIVPFNGQINLGQVLRQRYNAIDQHGVANVNCIDLPPAAYATSDLSTTLPMPMTAHADTFSSQYDSSNRVVTGNAYYPIANNGPQAWLSSVNTWCPPYDSNTVVLPTRDQNRLISRINGLQAMGATSINAGMRWGMELLDPGSRPMFATLASAGHIPSRFADRPYDFTRDDTLKVIVLMSDGENFAEERVNPAYRFGMSPIFRSTSDGYLSIFQANQVNSSNSTNICNSRPFWVPHRSAWMSRPWNGTAPSTSACYVPATWNSSATNVNAYSGSPRQTWPQVWGYVRMRWVAYQLYARPNTSSGTDRNNYADAMLNAFREQTSISDMDDQLQDMCEMAQDNGLSVYTIAFQAPANGQTQLSLCAPPNHYFQAGTGVDLNAAFRTIAAQINRLRLIE